MSANQQLDDLFLQRALEKGLLTDGQISEAREELASRGADEDIGAHEIVVEKGWIDVETALGLLDAGPNDTLSDVTARLTAGTTLEPTEQPSLDDELHRDSGDTARFESAGETMIDEPVHDVEIEPTDERFEEVPKLVEPLSPNYAVDAENTSTGESHLEMELPPPDSSSGDSIFDDSDSVPSLPNFDDGTQDELSPQSRTSLGDTDELSPSDSGRLDALDDMDLDAELEGEEEIVEEIVVDDGAPLIESADPGDTLVDPPPPGVGEPDMRSHDDLRPAPGEEQPEAPRRPGRDDTAGFDEEHLAVRTSDGTLGDDHELAPEFALRGAKGADMDFASFGEDTPPPADTDEEESDEITSAMSDSAVSEVMEQADDGYFGPPADLTTTPREMLEDSIAPPRPMDDGTLFDSEKLKAEAGNDDADEDFVATAPPGDNVQEPVSSEVTDDSDIDVSVTLPGDFPTGDEPTDDESNIGLEEIDDDSQLSEVTTGSKTQFATGEVARPGLRNRSESKLGVESDITGETGRGEEIHGHEMTLADLRQQMGLGAGVKIGGPGEEPSAVGRLKKSKNKKKKRYSVIREIARGGMGKVIEVEDNDLRRSVALKVLRKEMLERRDLVERFLEEAQITGQLEHPNIVPVHEIGVDGRGNLYFTMKLVEGEELSSVLKRLRKKDPSAERAYPLSRLVDVFIKVCEGVSFAHSRGVIHRDLKPANIMVGRFGEVQIMDWGVAKIIGRKEDTADREVRSDRQDDDASRTMAGSILGTPSYMSPEQAAGEVNSMGPESDVFSLGVILYEILCLRTPWTAQTSAQVLDQVKNFEPDPPGKRESGRRIPPELEQLALKCLNKRPDKRVGSAEELIDDLRKWQEGGTLAAVEYSIGQLIGKWITRHKVAVIFVVVILLALTGGGIGAAQYFEQQNLEKASNLVADAQDMLSNAQAAFDAGDYGRSEELAREANNDFTSALRIDESNEEAIRLQSEASILVASSARAIADREESEREAREQKRRLEELNAALVEARNTLSDAEEMEARGESLSKVQEAYHSANDDFLSARSIKVEGADEEKAEIAAALNTIGNWLSGYEERKAAEEEMAKLRAFVSDAQGKLAAAREFGAADYGKASEGFVNTISVCDQAMAVAVSGTQADRLRDQALDIKAEAAHEFARLAMDGGNFDVADLMLNTARSTGKLGDEIFATRKALEKRVEEQSRFTTLMNDARDAVNKKEWVLAQSQIQAALSEAESSEFATDRDRESLQRMYELAQLEEVRLTDARARTSEDLSRVLSTYNELLENLTDPDYTTRTLTYRDEVRLRLGSALYTEALESEDLEVKAEMFERAVEFITDRARLAEINAELSDIKLQLAMKRVGDELVLLPRGNFIVGSNRDGDNNPQRVFEQQDFVFIDKYLVTNEQFKQFVDAGGYETPEYWPEEARPLLSQFIDSTGSPGPATWVEGGFDATLAKYPVAGVSWFEAAAYAKWAGKRLPTPEEWELAGGAPQSGSVQEPGEYPFGARETAPPAGVGEPREVGTTEWDASARGVRDMGCNVAEWTARRNEGRGIVKGAPPGLRPELWFRYARRAKNSVARLMDRGEGRGFRCAQDFNLGEKDGGDGE